MPYSAYLGIPELTYVASETVANALAAFLKEADGVQVTSDAGGLQLDWDGWALRIWITWDPGLLMEMKAMAEKIAPGQPQIAAMRAAGTLLQIAGEDDPELDHFNDYLLAVESLMDGIPGSVGVDLITGEFW